MSSGRVCWVGLEQRPVDGGDPYGGRLAGRMLFGDFCLGFVRALAVHDRLAATSDQHLGHLPHAASWDQGPDGSVYAVTFGDCDTVDLDESRPPPAALWRAVAAVGP